ncbi:hypothetical protein HDU93_004328 [Gonapodya sp. JEL0774]|nr:hypothetical protein HDU93_004328 [Gonapodya sp. JEL0774]
MLKTAKLSSEMKSLEAQQENPSASHISSRGLDNPEQYQLSRHSDADHSNALSGKSPILGSAKSFVTLGQRGSLSTSFSDQPRTLLGTHEGLKYELPFLVEQLEYPDELIPASHGTESMGKLPTNAKHDHISYEDLANFHPYDPTSATNDERLSLMSYPASLPQVPDGPPHPRTRGSCSPSIRSSRDETLRISERDVWDFELGLEWKSVSDSTYKELMGAFGRDECRVHRGWEYKQVKIDSYNWRICYAPGALENIRADPTGALPRFQLTMFYNSFELFRTACKELPRWLPNLRVPTFAALLVDPLACPTEWSHVEPLGASKFFCNTQNVGLIVKVQGAKLSNKCRSSVERWTQDELWRITAMQKGLVGKSSTIAKAVTLSVARSIVRA